MLNSAIVGYGNIGPIHAEGLRASRYANLKLICDVQSNRADTGANQYGCRSVYDFDDVLKDDNVDVVHICTPHYLHKDMVLKSLSSHKHVLLEKPFAMNKSELKELMASADKSDQKVCIMLQNRKNHAVRVLKEATKQEKYGKLLAVSAFMTWNRDETYYAADAWRGKWKTEGGGLLINQAIHLLDLMGYIGGKIEAVKADISTKYLKGIIETEDTADALIFYESGVRGCFYATNNYAMTTPFQLIAEFEQARIRYSDDFLYEIKKGRIPRIIAENNKNNNGKDCWGSGHTQVIDEFYTALEHKTNDYMALSTGIETSKLLYSIYESAKCGSKKVNLED